MPINTEDWAIIAGVTHYPGLGDPLNGPENDARAFYQWAVDAVTGGGVPPSQAKCVLSSNFPLPFPNVLSAQPTSQIIQQYFDALVLDAEQKMAAGNPGRIGRRLYIFLAGHGCSPEDKPAAALLMANASIKIANHFSGPLYAEWFKKSKCFDEVILLMDCCRNRLPGVPLIPPPYDSLTADPEANFLYGFATKWSRVSREKEFNGAVRGVFSWALMEGLKGGASDVNGVVTGRSLIDFVRENMDNAFTPEEKIELENLRISIEADWQFDDNALANLVLAKVPATGPRLTTVNFRLVSSATDVGFDVFDNKFQPVGPGTHPLTAGAATLRLSKGIYLAELKPSGRKTMFDVPALGTGGVHDVQL